MSRVPFALVGAVVAATVVLCSASRAAAQNIVSQTACGGVNGVNRCVTNGFLHDIVVNVQRRFPVRTGANGAGADYGSRRTEPPKALRQLPGIQRGGRNARAEPEWKKTAKEERV